MQGIWSAQAADDAELVSKTLYSDAGSELIFNFDSRVQITGESLAPGVTIHPAKQQAETICLAAGARIAGIHFHPAVAYGIWGEVHRQSVHLKRDDDKQYALYTLFDALQSEYSADQQLALMQAWAESNLNLVDLLPPSLEQAIGAIASHQSSEKLEYQADLSQRQIERLFQLWIGMTPKKYQRLLRVKKAIQALQTQPELDLAELAALFGFSDQAHMTREFQAIAGVTPGKLLKV